MPGSLDERKMLVVVFVIHPTCCKMLDRLRQQMRVVGALYLLRNFRFVLFCGMDHQRVPFNQRPFYRFLGAVNLETLPVLAGGIKQRPVNMGAQIRIAEFDMGGFHGKGRSVMVVQFFTDCSLLETRHVFSPAARKSEYGADAMRRPMPGRQRSAEHTSA